MPYKPNDYYARKAKAEDYKARSVYKLQEIDEKYHIIHRGQTVLDLGASPGSWSQFLSEKIGAKGRLLGIDLTPIDFQLLNGVFVTADINEYQFDESCPVPPPYDLVVSDMAPKTMGIKSADQARSFNLCHMALYVAQQHLKTHGAFVCKMFDGPDFQEFRQMMMETFQKVHVVRPKSTRSESKEIFWVGIDKKATNPQP